MSTAAAIACSSFPGATPGIAAPSVSITGGTSDVSLTPELNTSAYSATGGNEEVHASTDWQISDDANFSNIVWQAAGSASLTQITVGVALEDDTTYYLRARHNSASYVSEWSSAVTFATISVFVTTPSITSPADEATDIGETPTLTSSAFAVTSGSDTHASSDWQIASDSGFSSIVVQTTDDASNLESWTVPSGNLSTSTTYYARVRHTGAAEGDSAWSATVSFTTAASFAYTYTNTEAQAFESAADTTGWDDTLRGDIDQLFSDLKSGQINGTNVLSKLDFLYLHDLPNEADSLRCVIDPTRVATNNGATHAPGEGFTGDRSSAHIDTNYNPNTDATNYTVNSASFGAWLRTVGSGDLMGARQSSRCNLRGAGQLRGPNQNSTTQLTSAGWSAGLWVADRSGANSRDLYVDGVSVDSDTETATTSPNVNFYVLAGNSSDIALDDPSSHQVSASFGGGSLSANEQADFHDALNRYRTAREAA